MNRRSLPNHYFNPGGDYEPNRAIDGFLLFVVVLASTVGLMTCEILLFIFRK